MHSYILSQYSNLVVWITISVRCRYDTTYTTVWCFIDLLKLEGIELVSQPVDRKTKKAENVSEYSKLALQGGHKGWYTQ